MISREGKMRFDSVCLWAILLPLAVGACDSIADASATRIRLIVETDAGGDPDDEQSLVRFLLYASEWDVEGIIANRPQTRRPENRNPADTGLDVVRRPLDACGQCRPNLVRHDPRHSEKEFLWRRTVPGYNDTEEAVNLILAAVDEDDSRPLWIDLRTGAATSGASVQAGGECSWTSSLQGDAVHLLKKKGSEP